MTIEKAIRLARKWADGHVCTLRDGEAQEYHQMCAEALEKFRWISVKERLPEEDGFYLVWGPAIYCGTKWYDQRSLAKYLWKHDVTHWMHLPKAPTEEEV